MVNSHQCIPMSKTVKIKSRKHKCGYRMKTINYYRHEYVITCKELTSDITDTIYGTHTAKYDTVGIKWDVPEVDNGENDKQPRHIVWMANTLIIIGVTVMALSVAVIFYILAEAIFGGK